MLVRWTEQAREDLRTLYAHIAEDDVGAARGLVGKLKQASARAGQTPWAGRVVPEFEVAELRERIAAPYRVVYLVRAEAVVIVRIWHERRLLTAEALPGPDGG